MLIDQANAEMNMADYRRLYIPGGTYFFTVVAHQRRGILTEPILRQALRRAITKVRRRHPIGILSFVLLPDHLHTIWSLPSGDCDFSTRWMLIKSLVSRSCGPGHTLIWQPRFWEHAIRDEEDFTRHLDYVHWNPMKHGLVRRVSDWPWSSFHRYAANGVYPVDWCGPGDDSDFE